MWILLGAFVAGVLAPGMVEAQDAREDGAPETSDDATSPPPADDAPSSPPAADAPPVDEAAAADAPPADDSPTGADGGHPASPESEGEGAAADALVPPSALEMAEAVLPEGQPLRSSAILRIVIGADGRVADASVIESAGEAFDAAAIDALRRSRFRPAMRAGEALAVALEYRFVFPLATRTEPPRESEVRALNDDATVQDAGAQGALTDGPDGETVPDEGDDESFGARARVSLDRAGIIERSVEAVNAIDTTAFADRAVDLGDVVAREQGVSLRRAGGLGSTSRICLVGFCDQQVRYFLDGVPLAAAGFPFGVANVPVGLVGTVEIYRGVVPLRLGADALGGAIDLRTGSALRTNSVAASYQVGSFGTHRATLAGRLHRGNFIAGATAFVDHTDNDYEIDVEVADERGRLSPARVRRFHDEYTAVGVALDAGLVDLPYARRLQLRLFGTGLRKEQQHNIVMTVPYGGVVGSDRVLGASLRHEVERGRLELDSVLNVSLRRTTFRDVSDQVFDWFGEVIRERRSPGEIQSVPIDQFFDEVSVFARLNAAINLADGHELQLSVVPTFGSRNGTDRLHDPEDGRNPLDARQRLFTTVVGAAYETEIVPEVLDAVGFVKYYAYRADAEQALPGGVFRELDERSHTGGAGAAVRVFLGESAWIKTSYEYATRLPTTQEVFGDGRLIAANLELVPERSHNANLGFQLDLRGRSSGAWRSDINLFARRARDLVVLLGNDTFFTYQNVFGARSLGAEASLGWTSPGDWVSVDVNGTYQDVRNTSGQGTFGAFEGDRIPNRPYAFFNARAEFGVSDLITDDRLRIGGDLRYVHGFFRGWESQGLRAFKQTVDAQLVAGAFIGYRIRSPLSLSVNFEVQNLGDARAFDFFGVQRPGRAFFLKVTGSFEADES